jgi:hypothetical protein
MGKFFFKHALISTPTALFFNMCAAPLVGMVQSGTKQEILDKAAAADFAARSKRGTKICNKLHEKKNSSGKSVHAVKLHEEKDAAGRSVHAVKMGTTVHEEKNADSKSLHNTKLLEEKDAAGKSAHAVSIASKLHKKKAAAGKSVHACLQAARGEGRRRQERARPRDALQAQVQRSGRRGQNKLRMAPTAPSCTSTPLPLKIMATSASTSDAETLVRFWDSTMLCTE